MIVDDVLQLTGPWEKVTIVKTDEEGHSRIVFEGLSGAALKYLRVEPVASLYVCSDYSLGIEVDDGETDHV